MRHPVGACLCVVAVVVLVAVGGHAEPAGDGCVPLFNGKDLSGFEGDMRYWSVVDGAIVGQTSEANALERSTYLFAPGSFAGDFELRVKFNLLSGNSGVQYRSRQLPDFQVAGYQADMDADHKYTGILYEVEGRKFVARRGQTLVYDESGKVSETAQPAPDATLRAAVKDGWNDYTITARGPRVIHQINGVTFIDVTDRDARRIQGDRIAFQLHQGPPMKVMFKALRIKPLK